MLGFTKTARSIFFGGAFILDFSFQHVIYFFSNHRRGTSDKSMAGKKTFYSKNVHRFFQAVIWIKKFFSPHFFFLFFFSCIFKKYIYIFVLKFKDKRNSK